MKQKALAGAVLAILLVLFHVVIFAVPVERNVIFWVSYGFTALALFLQLGICMVAFRKTPTLKSKFLGFPIFYIGTVYLAVQLILCAVFIGVGTFIPVWIPVIVYVLLVGTVSVLLVTTEAARDEIKRIDHRTEKKRLFIQSLRTEAEMLAFKASEPGLKTKLNQLSETIRYSDPMSSETLASLEHQIETMMQELRLKVQAGDKTAEELIGELNQLLAERNRKCKILK